MKKHFYLIVSCFVINISCNSDFDDKIDSQLMIGCDESNTEFQNIYNNILQDPNSYDDVSIDLEVHEITISLSSTKNICKIGYQSQHSNSTIPYTIEIFDNTNNQIVYSGSHLFSQLNTSYVTLNSPITLNANNSYSIRRIQNIISTDLSDLLGRYVFVNDLSNPGTTNILPATSGFLTIESSSSYSIGSTSNNQYLDSLVYIDIVFEN
ncbi:hypothetical protein [Flavobacterium okayamense]|nr:hypothetical protein [Flavobacterium okayamense]